MMYEYEGMQFQLDAQLNGKFYCRIYKSGISGPIFFTDDYDSEEQAVEAAKAIIRDHRAMTGEL
jgi:hypothetical protein